MYKNKIVCLLLVIIGMSLVICSCGKSVKNEKEIERDLINNADFYSEQEVDIDNVKITNRLTDRQNKSDKVNVQLNVSNDKVKGIISYVLNYHLYDQGWVLEGVQRDMNGIWGFEPSNAPMSEKEALEYIAQETEKKEINYDGSEGDFRSGHMTFVCVREEKSDISIAHFKYSFDSDFDQNSGIWSNSRINVIADEIEWNLVGEYEYKEPRHYWDSNETIGYYTYKLNISSVEGEKYHIDAEVVDMDGKVKRDKRDFMLSDIGNGGKDILIRSSYERDGYISLINDDYSIEIRNDGIRLNGKGGAIFNKIK